MFLFVSSLVRMEKLGSSRWKVNYSNLAQGKSWISACVSTYCSRNILRVERNGMNHICLSSRLGSLRYWNEILNWTFSCSILDPVPLSINPYIRHWEPARFSRHSFDQAHEVHEQSRRRKREINYNHYSPHYGSTNVIKFNFYAHDR